MLDCVLPALATASRQQKQLKTKSGSESRSQVDEALRITARFVNPVADEDLLNAFEDAALAAVHYTR